VCRLIDGEAAAKVLSCLCPCDRMLAESEYDQGNEINEESRHLDSVVAVAEFYAAMGRMGLPLGTRLR
jgi:hypothetical protein